MFAYIFVPVSLILVVGYLVFRGLRSKKLLLGSDSLDFNVLEIQVPKTSDTELETAPIAAEHMFASLHGLLREDYDLQEYFSFEIVSDSEGIRFYSAVPKSITKFVESQVYAQYPTAHIKVVEDYAIDPASDESFEVGTLRLTRRNFYPIKTFRDFEVDPLSAITSVQSGIEPGEKLWFQLLVKPLPDVWQEEGYTYIDSIRAGETDKGSSIFTELPKGVLAEMGQIVIHFFSSLLAGPSDSVPFGGGESGGSVTLSAGQELEIKAIEDKLTKMGFDAMIRIMSSSSSRERASSNLRALNASMRQFSTANLNSFDLSSVTSTLSGYEDYQKRTFDYGDSFILNIEELASIFHLPSASVATPHITWVQSKKAEPPQNLPTQNCTYIGDALFRDTRMRFGISNETDDRVRHMYLIGKSGTGKSTLFLNMIVQDIMNGYGVGVLDPHGELIDNILNYIPDERIEDVVIVDPSDVNAPVGINVLETDDPSQKNLMASGLLSAVKQHFDYSWGPRLEYLLNYAILTLLEVEGTTMLGITRLLNDMNYQKYILHKVKDPVVVDFWEKEYKGMRGNQRLITEAVAPIQNKINRFLSSTTIRNILGQRNSTVDFWDVINSGKIMLINLSKGKIGEDNANLLGSLLVSRIQFMAMQRVKIPQEQRKPYYLYVDEFQNFAGGSFESILSESRKYQLGLYLTHQYTNQLPEELLDAVFGNVGTIASFSLGAPDARVLETEFAPYFDENDLISLERFQIYIKLMIDGQTSTPFSARILRPWAAGFELFEKNNNRERVIQRSREKFGGNREYIEKKIRKWVDRRFDKGMAIAEEYREEKKE